MPLPQSATHEPSHKRTMTDDAGDYWYRTSADVLRTLGPEASSTPPRSQSRSQSQSQKQVRLKPPIQSPPASPPRAPGTGLVQQFSQLSTSETSQERGAALAPGLSDESNNQPGTTQIVEYPFEHLTRTDNSDPRFDQTTSQSRLIPSNELFFPQSQSPSFNIHQRPRSPASSPSLGGRRSSPSLRASPRRVFSNLNKGGGSSPPVSSAMPTQDPDLNTQTMDMDTGLDETAEGDSLDTQGTTPTQLDPTQLKYISATPISPDCPAKLDRFQETPPSGLEETGSGDGSGTQPSQIITQPTQLVTQSNDDMETHGRGSERVSRTSPPPITPLRLAESSRVLLEDSTMSHPISPQRAFTTPLSHPNSNLYRLDRSRKSSFAPPIRTRPDAQRPLPPLNTGLAPLQSTQHRWDAKRAEEEERDGRMTEVVALKLPPRTPSPRRCRIPPTAAGIGTQDVLTESTPFVSGRAGTRTPRLSSPFSPKKMDLGDDPTTDVDDSFTEPEMNTPEPPKHVTSVSHRGSSLPLEAGRVARQETKQREKDVQEHSERHESEDDATPQRPMKPSRGVPTARRGRGRGRGRGRSVANTPRTPLEAQSDPKSPARTTSTGRKRARGDMPREKSPAPAKRPKIQAISCSTTPAPPKSVGTRVLAWWSGGNYFFGTIMSEESKGRWEIGFDDGTSSKVPLTRIRRAALQVGDNIQVKDGGSMVNATVLGITNWETKRKVRVSIIHDGKDVRKEVESRAISIPTKTVTKSWGNRMFNGGPSTSSTKRKTAASQGGTTSKTRSKLAGYAFVLTLKAEDVGVGEKELEGWKVKLRSKIEGHGGVVVDEWEELFSIRGREDANGWYAEGAALHYTGATSWPDVRKVFLLSGRIGTTPKYLMALALGVPCLSYKWVDEFLKDDTSQWMDALLPRGMSDFYQTEISQVVDPQLQSATNMVDTLLESNVTRKPFKGSSVLCIFKRAKKIQPEGIDKGKFYSRVACVMGASTVHLVPDIDINSLALPQPILEYDYVICENTTTLQTVKSTIGAAGRSTEWVKQCIIMVIGIVLLVFWRSKPKLTVVRNRPTSVKPPLIDRAQMERLGMYDDPEPFDIEWMGSLAATSRVNALQGGVPPVTQLPDFSPLKQNKNILVSNSLADWKLCEFRGRQCRVLLPVSIGEQESKAQLHLQQNR
ncbi:hypothetical protein BN14_00009 [Rhizoctonia solani AG-1 IB]|uniref:DNA repair protein Crb2 Tudor domain-containing protein n=1 Tax=Thanatephorus cucumeris (strain AG1-IB / isolate 7/3/14) TaxID=1108050 RepID=M5BJ24_THACB|nr:hypothetical protein BN14_00009 [Rhizoctonia solani AG-1 IB]